MTTSDGQPRHPATVAAETRPPALGARRTDPPSAADLVSAAARPGIDPCDVACEAMPAHLLGDLAPPEATWLLDHTAGCGYCANELGRFERSGDLLDRVHRLGAAPPPPRLPRRRRAAYARLESPLGPLLVATTDAGLCEIDFGEEESEEVFRRRLAARGFDPHPIPEGCDAGDDATAVATMVDVAAQLRQYFAARRDRFDLPLDFAGVSPFTRAVLEATNDVPFGRLETYRGIADRVGKPTATRAVGNALGRNPIPVVVPCHRIVRTGGGLGGYTGGLRIKQHLLALEGVTLA